MLLSACLLSTALASAASAHVIDTTFSPTGFTDHLNSLNLTTLVQVIGQASTTPGGQTFLQNVGGPSKTFLAPVNAAIEAMHGLSLFGNMTEAEAAGYHLTYHLLSGSFPASSIATVPAHTIASTYFNLPGLVLLEGGKTQAIVLAAQDGAINVLNQQQPIKVLSTSTYQDLTIHVVDHVAIPPLHNAEEANFASQNLTVVPQLLMKANFSGFAIGDTIFIPNDAAFSSHPEFASLDQASLTAVILNHVINGTTIYSPEFGQAAQTSAAGQPITFISNSTGLFASSGSITAKVVASDLLLPNGVMHIIDTVLFNTVLNPAAASSAYEAASSAAAQGGSMSTGAFGPTATAASSQASESGIAASNKSSGAPRVDVNQRTALISVGMLLIGGLTGAFVA